MIYLCFNSDFPLSPAKARRNCTFWADFHGLKPWLQRRLQIKNPVPLLKVWPRLIEPHFPSLWDGLPRINLIVKSETNTFQLSRRQMWAQMVIQIFIACKSWSNKLWRIFYFYLGNSYFVKLVLQPPVFFIFD